MDLDDLLTAEGRSVFERHMAVTDAEGRVVTNPGAVAFRMLTLLSNRHGVGDRPGEGLHFGRATVLPLLIEALVGPDPDEEAWMAAIAEGSFDLSIGKRYGRVANEGPPGTYLPRLIGRLLKEQKKSNASPIQIKRYRTALGILIASVLLKELKNATNARAAVGSAWPLMRAITHRKYAELRRALTQLGNDEAFLAHLAEGIEALVGAWVRDHHISVAVTNGQANKAVPPGADVASYFAKQRSANERRREALVEFGNALLGLAHPKDDVACQAIALLDRNPVFAEVRKLVVSSADQATAYLDKVDWEQKGEERAIHDGRLQLLMQICRGPSSVDQIMGRALLAVRFTNQSFEADEIITTGIAMADIAAAKTASRILAYAREIGPPPPGTPIDHLHWFEVSACYLTFQQDWEAESRWEAAGLLPATPSPKQRMIFYGLLNDLTLNFTVG